MDRLLHGGTRRARLPLPGQVLGRHRLGGGILIRGQWQVIQVPGSPGGGGGGGTVVSVVCSKVIHLKCIHVSSVPFGLWLVVVVAADHHMLLLLCQWAMVIVCSMVIVATFPRSFRVGHLEFHQHLFDTGYFLCVGSKRILLCFVVPF